MVKHLQFYSLLFHLFRRGVLRQAHDGCTGVHLGQVRTFKKIQRIYWVGYRRIVELWVNSCSKCQARKLPKQKPRAALRLAPVGAPFERIAMDILGPLPLTHNGNRYVLVIMDYFTKWAEAYALPNQQAETIANVLVTEFICRYGIPLQIHSDQGTNFESNLFHHLCSLLGIDKTRTTAYHPQSDGLVERFNRTLETMISMYCRADQTDWDIHLPFVLMAYRASQQETTGATPNSLIFGREVCLPLDILAGRTPDAPVLDPRSYAMQVHKKLESAFQMARQHSSGEQRRQKRLYDARLHGSPYKVGDTVWLYCPERHVGLSPKLRSHWKGPCTVLKKYSEANYLVKVPTASKQRQVVHYDRLKPCVQRDVAKPGQPTGLHASGGDVPQQEELRISDDPDQVIGLSGTTTEHGNDFHADADPGTNTMIHVPDDTHGPGSTFAIPVENRAVSHRCRKLRPPVWMQDFVR